MKETSTWVIIVTQSLDSWDYPTFPNKPKGIKTVLTECGLFQPGLDHTKRQNKCEGENCCNNRILEHQTDFCDQKSLVQVNKAMLGPRHLCNFFAKIPLWTEFYWAVLGLFKMGVSRASCVVKRGWPWTQRPRCSWVHSTSRDLSVSLISRDPRPNLDPLAQIFHALT